MYTCQLWLLAECWHASIEFIVDHHHYQHGASTAIAYTLQEEWSWAGPGTHWSSSECLAGGVMCYQLHDKAKLLEVNLETYARQESKESLPCRCYKLWALMAFDSGNLAIASASVGVRRLWWEVSWRLRTHQRCTQSVLINVLAW